MLFIKKRFFFLCLAGFLLGVGGCQKAPPVVVSPGIDDTARIEAAFQSQQSDIWVTASGVVTRLLPDDLKGSRHQRFILRLKNGQTLLMSYNIDIAERIDTLKAGDEIQFRGEYEWNGKGGVVHWLHHDPSGKMPGGWIKFQGKIYQ